MTPPPHPQNPDSVEVRTRTLVFLKRLLRWAGAYDGVSMRAVCLKHVPFEGPGAFATALTARGVSLEHYLVPQVGLPKDTGDLLIVIGGPVW